MEGNKPWLQYYGDVPHTIDYPEVTMYEALIQAVALCPDAKQVERVKGFVVLKDPGKAGP